MPHVRGATWREGDTWCAFGKSSLPWKSKPILLARRAVNAAASSNTAFGFVSMSNGVAKSQFDTTGDVTRIIERAQKGDPKAAAELLPLVYDEL